jgi:imidazolonepropionase-like amidohydrolase
MNRLAAIACVFLFALVAPAMGSRQASLVLKVGTLVDVESGTTSSNQLILIEGEYIKAVAGSLAIPTGARVIDLGRATVLPGLIDAHTHLLTNGNPDLGNDDNNLNLIVTQMNLASRGLLGAAMAREVLDAGITTVRDLGNSGWGGDVALRDAINSGWVVGPRMVVSTRALSAVGGQFARVTPATSNIIEQEFAQVTGANEARRAVRQAIFDGADVIKVIASNGNSLKLDELKVIVDEAHGARRKVAAHISDDQSARVALEAGVDSIEHGWFLSDDVLRIMAAQKTFLVPTDESFSRWADMYGVDSPYAARNKAIFDRTHQRLRRAFELGVPVALGSDQYYRAKWTRGVASVMRMVRSARDAGIDPIEVVRSATLRAAQLLGWQERVGQIRPGRLADLIAVEGNPLQDSAVLERVVFVLKGGVVIRNDLGR